MEDFNLPSPERVALLQRLQAAIGDAPPHFWAACQICDLKALETLVECGEGYPAILRVIIPQTLTMAHYSGPYPGTQSQQSTPVLRRNTQSRNLAAERDKFRCVVTGDPVVEVVHIYPYHSIKHREEDASGQRHVVWNQLKMFWPEEKVAAWEAELFPDGISELGVERVYNLITLSRNAYYLWGHGAFALKPISESDDKKTLEVQFFWQKKQTDGRQAMSLSTSPFSTEGLDENTGSLQLPARLYDHSNDQRIKSGFCFKLHADDPTNKPLPSFQLLELQWFLQRVQGMAGAADVDWPSLSDSESDEEEIPDYGIY